MDDFFDVPLEPTRVPDPKRVPHAPSTDNPRDYFTSNALKRLIEHSKVFPKNDVVNFRNQEQIDILYWIEYMIGKFVEGEMSARIQIQKEQIIELISQHVNVLSFKKNKRNHAKVNRVFNNGHTFWLILMDEDSENAMDLKSISILTCTDANGLKFLFSKDDFAKFLNDNKINDKRTDVFKEIPVETKKHNFDVLQAGALSRAKHRVVKMARNLIKPRKQSMSRTSTFTRRYVRPEEYVNDNNFQSENYYRIAKLNELVESKSEKENTAYGRALKFFDMTSSARKKRRAKTLLRTLIEHTKDF